MFRKLLSLVNKVGGWWKVSIAKFHMIKQTWNFHESNETVASLSPKRIHKGKRGIQRALPMQLWSWFESSIKGAQAMIWTLFHRSFHLILFYLQQFWIGNRRRNLYHRLLIQKFRLHCFFTTSVLCSYSKMRLTARSTLIFCIRLFSISIDFYDLNDLVKCAI